MIFNYGMLIICQIIPMDLKNTPATYIDQTDKGDESGYKTAYLSQTHFVDEQRDRLRDFSDRLQSEKEVLSDIDQHIEQQRELRAELISMKFKTARAHRAK